MCTTLSTISKVADKTPRYETITKHLYARVPRSVIYNFSDFSVVGYINTTAKCVCIVFTVHTQQPRYIHTDKTFASTQPRARASLNAIYSHEINCRELTKGARALTKSGALAISYARRNQERAELASERALCGWIVGGRVHC